VGGVENISTNGGGNKDGKRILNHYELRQGSLPEMKDATEELAGNEISAAKLQHGGNSGKAPAWRNFRRSSGIPAKYFTV